MCWPTLTESFCEVGTITSRHSIQCLICVSQNDALSDIDLAILFQKKGIDGYFYIDQMAKNKFRLFRLILEIC